MKDFCYCTSDDFKRCVWRITLLQKSTTGGSASYNRWIRQKKYFPATMCEMPNDRQATRKDYCNAAAFSNSRRYDSGGRGTDRRVSNPLQKPENCASL
jgi:hypothetical protein